MSERAGPGPRARLLIVHHTPSPVTAELLAEVRAGSCDPEITGVETVARAALAATASDLLGADAVLLGTPANIGYMSGALKHFLDQVYYVCGDDTRGLPYGVWVHGGSDTSGAVRAVTAIAEGMGWTAAAAPVEVTGAPDARTRASCRELGAVLAATVMPEG